MVNDLVKNFNEFNEVKKGPKLSRLHLTEPLVFGILRHMNLQCLFKKTLLEYSYINMLFAIILYYFITAMTVSHI